MLSSCSSLKQETSFRTFYLVRHAEKVLDMRDPGLTKDGKERAYYFAQYFKDKSLDAIYSSDYYRTRKTAQPTCSAKNLKLNIYDPSNLSAFAKQLLKNHKKDNILVVGHSNTTPQLANLLVNSNAFAEWEEWQYDQMIVLKVYSKGNIDGQLIKLGKPSNVPN